MGASDIKSDTCPLDVDKLVVWLRLQTYWHQTCNFYLDTYIYPLFTLYIFPINLCTYSVPSETWRWTKAMTKRGWRDKQWVRFIISHLDIIGHPWGPRFLYGLDTIWLLKSKYKFHLLCSMINFRPNDLINKAIRPSETTRRVHIIFKAETSI